MDGHSFSRPRRSSRTFPKPRLEPPCSVFPDSLAQPHPPPPPTTPLPFPARFDNSKHDLSVRPSSSQDHVHLDPTMTAPIGAINDDYPEDKDIHLGAWYAFAKGIQSDIGSAIFADQDCRHKPRACRKGSGIEQTRSANGCMNESERCNHPHEPRRKAQWGSSYRDGGASTFESTDDECSECAEERILAAQSDSEESDESCDQHLFNIHTPPCRVNLIAQDSSPTTDIVEGDVTAEQAANGMDIQGIPWETLSCSREDYRAKRMHERQERSDVAEGLRSVIKEPRRGARFFDFFKNTRRVKCSIVHFQLRNLAWATSKHDVFVMNEAAILHWDAAAQKKTPVMDLGGSDVLNAVGLGGVQISTMIAKDELVIAGGFYGEVVAKNVKSGTIVHNQRITYDDNAITNAIDIFDNNVMTSNNDCYVRTFDMTTFQRKTSFGFEKAVNHATRQPNGKLVAVAGDDNPIQVIDGDNGQRVAQLHGHEDYSFATGWHPNGRMFATGSQDSTCRVWDVRNISQSFAVLGAHVGAVRSLRFSPCGRFLVMAEPRDFVHIFDVNRGEFDTCQEIDLFGEIAGIAVTPGAEGLFIAVCDRTYASLIEYERRARPSLSSIIL